MGLKIITPPSLEPIVLADVKLQCGIDTTDFDTLISGAIIPAARAKAENYMGSVLMQRTIEMTLDSFPSSGSAWASWWFASSAAFGSKAAADISFDAPPAWNDKCTVAIPLSITSVKYVDTAGVQQTLDPSLYTLDDSNWPFWVLPAFDTDWPATRSQANAVTIRYQLGYDDPAKIPGDVRAWLLLTAAFLVANREALTLLERGQSLVELPSRFIDSLLDPYRLFRL